MRSFEILVACLLFSGCMGSKLNARAASDFSCPESQLRTRQLNANSFRVEGCGHAATYVCDEFDGTCNREVDVAKEEQKQVDPTVVEGNGFRYSVPHGFKREGDDFVDTVGKHAVHVRIVTSDKSEEAFVKAHYADAESWTKVVEGHPMTFVIVPTFSEIRTSAIIAKEGKVYEITCAGPPTKPAATDAVCNSILLSFRVI
ncbi:MAG: hypothetical protein ACXWUG_15325 [Polyangiales bacterium]